MSSRSRGELDARLDALAARIEASLVRVHERAEPAWSLAPSTESSAAWETKLEAAEASARLQAQRCGALEDRVAELEAGLVGARNLQAQAEAALEQLRATRREHSSGRLDAQVSEAFQSKLLEVERLTSERDALRRSNEELRNRAREHRRQLDHLEPIAVELERSKAKLAELSARDETANKRIGDLERLIAEQQRELELAERRAKHLREHFAVR